jgi:hypothetical protein
VISIFDARPIETGAVIARTGFLFQDEVTAGFVIRMLDDDTCIEVQCETADDCTRVLRQAMTIWLELVQAKSGEPDQLWSVNSITAPSGSSLVDGFLNRDRFAEPAQFRAVTVRQVRAELHPLRLRRGTPERAAAASAEASLAAAVRARVQRASSNGIDGERWVALTEWDEKSAVAVHNENLLRLGKYLASQGWTLLPDQVETIYGELVERVIAAATSAIFEEKRMTRERAIELAGGATERVTARDGKTSRLQKKMRDAGIEETDVETAVVLRAEYLRAVRARGYQSADDAGENSRNVMVELMSLRLQRTDEGELASIGCSRWPKATMTGGHI